MSDSRDGPSAFRDAVEGLLRGDFSRLEPLFFDAGDPASGRSKIHDWVEAGAFDAEPAALAEALTCACFNGRVAVAAYLLDRGVDPAAGSGTGLDALHWAANRGQIASVRLLLDRGAPVETRSRFDGSALGTAVWSAVHEPRLTHPAIVEMLLAAGARTDDIAYPTGVAGVDEVLRRHGVGAA